MDYIAIYGLMLVFGGFGMGIGYAIGHVIGYKKGVERESDSGEQRRKKPCKIEKRGFCASYLRL